MVNLKKVSRAQWCFFALFIGFAFLMQNCTEDDALIYEENQIPAELSSKGPPVKVTVCRYNARKNTYSIVTVVAKNVQTSTDVFYEQDEDGDGYPRKSECPEIVSSRGDGLWDCNDNDYNIYPGAEEICDGKDNNCDDIIDENIPTEFYYADSDGDSYGDPDNYKEACSKPVGYVTDNTDCDDTNYGINPVAEEICRDNKDNDCDGQIDEGCNVDLSQVPDDNFEAYLETHNADGGIVAIGNTDSMGNGIANDNNVFTENINKVTSLNVSSLGIYDLTGIGGFAALETLHCGANLLTSLNLSQNTKLITIVCAGNDLTSINVDYLANLNHLDCNGKNDGNDSNKLTELDLSDNIALTYLACTNNRITNLNLSNNPKMNNLQCNLNSLSSLTISNCTLLEYLYCQDNILTSIDVSPFTALLEFECYGNQLSSLDVSANTYLERLYCYGNTLLECIQVNTNQLNNYTSWDWDIGSAVCKIDCSSE